MTDDSSSRKKYPVNALIVAFALVVLGIGLGSVFRMTKDDGPKQDPPAAVVVAPQPMAGRRRFLGLITSSRNPLIRV